MYEPADKRRDGSINKWDDGLYTPRFQNTDCLTQVCSTCRIQSSSGDVDLNYCNNLRIFRYAETLLNYVELVKMHGQSEEQGVSAQDCLDQIRSRAGVGSIQPTEENIKLERRREFWEKVCVSGFGTLGRCTDSFDGK